MQITLPMLEAGMRAYCARDTRVEGYDNIVVDIFNAMLAAAPGGGTVVQFRDIWAYGTGGTSSIEGLLNETNLPRNSADPRVCVINPSEQRS